jgi:hypothetical protein
VGKAKTRIARLIFKPGPTDARREGRTFKLNSFKAIPTGSGLQGLDRAQSGDHRGDARQRVQPHEPLPAGREQLQTAETRAR